MIQIPDNHVRHCLNLFLASLVVVLPVFQTVNMVARVSYDNRFITCSKVPLSIRNAVLLLVWNCEIIRLKLTKLICLFRRCSILLVRGFSILIRNSSIKISDFVTNQQFTSGNRESGQVFSLSIRFRLICLTLIRNHYIIQHTKVELYY